MRKRHRSGILLNCGKLLLLAIALGALLISAANYLPVNPVNRQESLAQLDSEGFFPEVPSMEGGDGSFHSQNPTALELATDRLMVEMALYDGEDSGIIQAFRCFSTQSQYQKEYSRYWHGYVVILRFLLIFFNYYEMRIINGICQMLIFSAISYFVLKRKGVKYALAFATSYILLMPAALAQCFQYSWVYYAAFGSLLVFLKWEDYFEQRERYIYFFLLVGAVTTYLDLLTYPLLTWGLVITWWLLLQKDQGSIAGNVLKVIFSGISWITGYAVMWMGKWAVGSLVLRENLFQKAISEALLWTVDGMEESITLGERFRTLYINWETYSYKIYFVIIAIWGLYVLARGILGYTRDARMPALLLTGLSSIVWYVVMAGHTNMHHIFTHRIYGVSIAAFLGMALLSTQGKPALPTAEKWLYHCLATALTGGGALLLLLFLRSDYSVNNYAFSFEKILANDTISINFVPSFSRITRINIGISVEGGSAGEYRISLSDGEETIYERTVPVYEWSEGNLHELAVDWNLTAGKDYTLQIDQAKADGNTYLHVTADGFIPLAEYKEITVGGEYLPGQMLTEVNYWCRPVGKYNCLFWFFTFAGVCFMVITACLSSAGADGENCLRNMGR